MTEQLYKTLKQFFGFDSFRKGQEEIILNILDGKDTLVVMPTGGGKSLCYQLPALHFEGTALVISPLIALMQDQVDSMEKKGIPAAFINSTLTFDETLLRMEKARTGEYKLLYVAPERLENKRFIEALRSFQISFLAVDEAHCISEWGHDFRPSYLHIAEALKFINEIPVIALTATATPEVQIDIFRALKMKDAGCFIKGFDRPNLAYITETTEDKLNRVVDICKETTKGSTIIYCGSRKKVESFTEGLMEYGLKVISYHAGMPDKFRTYAQDKFLNGDARIIVATSAFGMGIDKPDVRNVIHCDLTQTLEAYYQEAGRAGRDGKPAKCYLLYHPSDRKLPEFFINATFPSLQNIDTVYNFIYDINSTPLGTKSYDSIFLSHTEIANSTNLPSIVVHSVINLLERNKILKHGSTQGMAVVNITTSRERIIEYYNNIDSSKRKVLEAILRGVSPDVFNNPVEFDIQHFMRKYDINIDELKTAVRTFEFARLMKFNFPGFSKGISLLLERMYVKDLPIDFNAYKSRRSHAVKKLNLMQQYAETFECKRNFILNYFNDSDIDGTCGRCSSCTDFSVKSKKLSFRQKYLERKIVETAYELNGMFGKTILANYLKGYSNDSIKRHNLSKGSSFAQCSEYSFEEIKQGIEIAIYTEKLISSNDKYATLSPAEELLPKLKGLKQFKFRTPQKTHDVALLKLLKELRKELAAYNKVVERAIISDSALKTISQIKPVTIEELMQIHGIGPVFRNNFAKFFINAIRKYQNQRDNNDDTLNKLPETVRNVVLYTKKGYDLNTIAKKLKLTKVETARNIQLAIESGVPLKTEQFYNNDTYKEVKVLVEGKQGITLRELRNTISLPADYAILRIMLATARNELKQ
ncbi:RecQ family ATP-dependent DNA helicase [Bacteroidota bacterium]